MKTTLRNEELNAASERAHKRINDEFIRKQIQLYKQEQAKKKQGDMATSGTETSRQTEKADGR
jgi:hypothetical protein